MGPSHRAHGAGEAGAGHPGRAVLQPHGAGEPGTAARGRAQQVAARGRPAAARPPQRPGAAHREARLQPERRLLPHRCWLLQPLPCTKEGVAVNSCIAASPCLQQIFAGDWLSGRDWRGKLALAPNILLGLREVQLCLSRWRDCGYSKRCRKRRSMMVVCRAKEQGHPDFWAGAAGARGGAASCPQGPGEPGGRAQGFRLR